MTHHNLSEEEREKLLDPFPVESSIDTTLNNHTLPYEELGGLRFERLCYEILCSEGKNPRYNGKSGQEDYGVDIVTENKNSITVYQCKNIKDKKSLNESVNDIKRAFNKVVDRWVGEQGLPRPETFIYCSRQLFNNIKNDKEYTEWRDEAFKKYRIHIQFWGRDTLNSKLRDLPAVVSGIFSDRIAQLFCSEYSLPKDSSWERLQYKYSDYPQITDFYEDWEKDRLFIDPKLKEWFSSALLSSKVVLLHGPPGTGKTITALSLLVKLKNRPERIYYTVTSKFEKTHQLIDSVKSRAQLPSVFILDDCHSAPDMAVELIQGLRGTLLRTNHKVSIRLVLLMRGILEDEGSPYLDSVKHQLELDEDNAKYIPLSDSKHLLQVLKKRLPHINTMTLCHANHIFTLTGGNLALAKLAVNGIESADELLRLDGYSIKSNVQRLYINKIYVEDRKPMKRMCGLSMFDITPLTDYLSLSKNVLGTGLITQLYSPSRIRFSHSSLAEVFFYVLVDMDEEVSDNWNTRINQDLIQYLKYLSGKHKSQLDAFFLNLSSSQLFFPDFDMDRIISGFIDSPEFKTLLNSEPLVVRISVLRRVVAKVSLRKSEAVNDINDTMCRQVKFLCEKTETWNEEELSDFTEGIFGLSESSPDHLLSLENQVTVNQLITKIRQCGYIFDLFALIQNSSPSRAIELINAMTSADIDVLVKKNIEQQRSVGTLHLALRYLDQKTMEIDGKKQTLLTRLEKKVTAQHLLILIIKNGTIFELFNLLQYSSPSRAGEIIKSLTSADIDVLVKKTIEQQRYVGTLYLALRDLDQKTVEIDGKKQTLLTELEKKVTAQHLLILIIKNWTILELFNLLQYSSPSRAGEIIKSLTSADIDALVKKTIEQQRSVGTLHLALRYLDQKTMEIDGKKQTLLTRLEKKVTAQHLLILIIKNGTIFELFMLLKYSSPSLAVELINAMTSADIDALVDKTIEQQRSVGTLHLALRDLDQKMVEIEGKGQTLLTVLEKIVTAPHLLKLIVNNGTIFELFNLLQYSSPSRAGSLINALTSADIDALVNKTIEQQRSVGTLSFTLRDLDQKTVEIDGKKQTLLTGLEKIVTVPHLLKLIVNNGTIFELFRLLQYSSPSRAGALINAPTSADIDALVDKTIEQQRSVGTLSFTLRDLDQKTVEIDGKKKPLLTGLEKKVTAQHLLKLIIKNGTIFELFNLLQYSSPSRAGEIIKSLTSADIDVLVDKTVEQKRSVESLHYTFQTLRPYSNMIEELLNVLSPSIFAQLIVGAGTLNSLMIISGQLPEQYLIEFRVAISHYLTVEWQEFVFRGRPNNLINFLSQEMKHYPDTVRDLLATIVENEGARFLKKSTWHELNSANYDSDELITTILRNKLEHHLASTPVDAMFGLDFKEATHAVSIMWRYATHRHNVLNARLWEILPPQNQWPKDYNFGFIQNVIQHICHNDFNPENAEKLLCKSRDHALHINWTKATPSLVFYFFWQHWQASYHMSVSDPSPHFPESLSDKAIDLLTTLLSKKRKYQNPEKIMLYALAGLLFFIRPEKKQELRCIVEKKLTGIRFLHDEILTSLGNNSLGFVPAYFSLYGMGLVCDPNLNFTIGLRKALKTRFLEYPQTTSAVDKLFSELEKNTRRWDRI